MHLFFLQILFLFSTTIAFSINPPVNVSPTNTATDISTTITLDWSAVSGNTGYLYEIDTTPNFNSPLYGTGSSNTNSSQVSVTHLFFGTTYYWRAATVGPIDTSIWSSTTSFTTIDSVTNTSPANGTTGAFVTYNINWSSMTGNTGYLYQLDTVPAFNSNALRNETTGNNSSQANLYDLRFGTTYYWHAAIKNNVDTSNWGATWHFTTRDEVVNNSPADGAINRNTTIAINWDITSGNKGYLYEIDTSPNFNSPMYSTGATSTNSSQYYLSDLNFGTTYYWRAAIKNDVDTSGWGPTWSFTTLEALNNTSPSNGATNQNTSVVIDWSAMSGNTGYIYELDTTPNFNSSFYSSGPTITNSSQMSLSDLYFNTTYYWRAAAKNNSDTSDWGPTWSFTTRDGIVNFSPNFGSTNLATSLTLDWSSMTGNTGYLYEIDTSINFNSPLYTTGATATNSSLTNISDLYFNTTYYWRAAVTNNIDTSSWSPYYRFTTNNGVFNMSPGNNATGVSINPTLDWSTMNGNTGYLYEIDTSLLFNSTEFQTGLSAVNVSQENIAGLLYNTKYFWRVAITNNVDTSGWSNITNFTTEIFTSLDFSAEQIELKVYPNPVQNIVNIELDNLDNYKIKLINSQGAIVSEQIYPATNLIAINIESLSTGIYFLEVSTQNKNTSIIKVIKTE